MKIKLAYFILCTCLILGSHQLFAQIQGVKITGKVIDANSQQAIELATVMAGDKQSQKPITGVTTNADGTFELKIKSQNFYLDISFIGFETIRMEDVAIVNGKVDLGTILMYEDSEVLGEVVIEGERSKMEFHLDKRVFNVGKDLSSTGASALEVLNNIPSVNVNIEGEVSLRGSTGVQILINGKPSVLTSEEGNALGTITADMIEKVEVITNPSAKYNAEGTSGIINIVIKKDDRKGMNGSVSVNTGTPDNHSIGFSLNKRTEKLNLFTQIGVGYRELPNDIRNINRNLNSGITLFSEGKQFRNENFYNFILGADYYFNQYNVITLSGNFAYEIEDQPSLTNFMELDNTGAILSQWNRNETTEATNPKWQYEFQYKRDFKDHKDHTLLFSALGSFFGKDLTSEFDNTTISGIDNDGFQRTRSDFQEANYTLKLDYTRPFSEEWEMETGAQYVIQDVSNDYAVSNLIGGESIPIPELTNIFEYDQKVLGVYGTMAYEGDKWGIKAGLRVENTELNTFLATENQTENQNYTNLFPSAHTSYKFSDMFSLQAGYSRRVRRPRLWDLNPFFNIRNNFNIREGNPDLLPEFTDSYEITGIFDLEDVSFNFSIYHLYTTDVIERLSRIEVRDMDTVTIVSPDNIGTNRATGIEFNTKYTPNKWLSVNGDFNFNYFNREGSNEDNSFDFNASQWSSKLTTKFKLPLQIDFEITGQYRSSVQTVQGDRSDVIFADMGLRKKILGGRGVLNFSIRDIFASRVEETEVDQADFSVYSRRQRGRFIIFGFSFGFGKGEAMEFSGQRRRY